MSNTLEKIIDNHNIIITPWPHLPLLTIIISQRENGLNSYTTPIICISNKLAELLTNDGLEWADNDLFITSLAIANKRAIQMYNYTRIKKWK